MLRYEAAACIERQTGDGDVLFRSFIVTLRVWWRFVWLQEPNLEETILNAFKVFDPEGKGILKKE